MNYFYEIRLAQELFLEWQIQDNGLCYKIFVDNEHEIGYFIVSKDNVLIEYYLLQEFLALKEEVFSKVLSEYSIKKVYSKSFDSILLICSHMFSRNNKIMGIVFRDYVTGSNYEFENTLRVKLAHESDISRLLSHNSGLYDSPEELKYMVSNRMVYMFEKDSKLVGCGYLIKILSDKNFFDLGMWVNPDFRSRGYATMIVSYLKKYCFSHGYIPVCGCAVDNTAARKALERNGFISKHAIIEFDVYARSSSYKLFD